MTIYLCTDYKQYYPLCIHNSRNRNVTFISDLYKLTDEVLGQGAYAKVQGCISLQNGQEFAVKVSKYITSVTFHTGRKNMSLDRDEEKKHFEIQSISNLPERSSLTDPKQFFCGL